MIIRISIYHVIDRLGLIKLIHDVEQNGLKIAKDKVDKINDDNELILDIDDRYFREFNKTCLFKIMPKMQKNQFEFKPFDQVLVRDYDSDIWRCSLFSHKTENNDYFTTHAIWNQCIPYNENTAHLVGTNKPYKEPESKVWHVVNIKNGESYEFTYDEFEHFIKTAVLNNKDITDFNARYVNN